MRHAAAMLVLVLALAVPTTATGQRLNAPPGNSAVDEYLETIPSSSGNRVPGNAGRPVLTPAQRRRLEQLGADGAALADVVDATATPRRGRPAGGEEPVSVPQGDGRSPLRQAAAVAVGANEGGGLGPVLPVILLLSLFGAIAIAVRRRGST